MAEEKSENSGPGLRSALFVLAAQAGVTLFAALIMAVAFEGRAAWSAVVGGGISMVATAWFAARVFAVRGGDLRRLVRAFYVGEAQKIVLTAILIVAAIKWLSVAFLPMLGTYMATLLVFWFALLPVFGAGGGTNNDKQAENAWHRKP